VLPLLLRRWPDEKLSEAAKLPTENTWPAPFATPVVSRDVLLCGAATPTPPPRYDVPKAHRGGAVGGVVSSKLETRLTTAPMQPTVLTAAPAPVQSALV